MYAGTVSEIELIMEELYPLIGDEGLSREKIQSTIRVAYRKRLSKWSADRLLAPFDMEMEDFKTSGRAIFGEERQAELSRQIQDLARYFDPHILVIGWGKSEHAAMIYGIGPDGASSNAKSGFAAIGTGANVASSVMAMLGHSYSSSIDDTLYSVAAAKFSSEQCPGVGRETAFYVARKIDGRAKMENFLIEAEVQLLRETWEEYGKPQIYADVGPKLQALVKRFGSDIGMKSLFRKWKCLKEQKAE